MGRPVLRLRSRGGANAQRFAAFLLHGATGSGWSSLQMLRNVSHSLHGCGTAIALYPARISIVANGLRRKADVVEPVDTQDLKS